MWGVGCQMWGVGCGVWGVGCELLLQAIGRPVSFELPPSGAVGRPVSCELHSCVCVKKPKENQNIMELSHFALYLAALLTKNYQLRNKGRYHQK